MEILLLGYGKMGKIIEKIAEERGHTIHSKLNSKNKNDIKNISREDVDVAIDFSGPHSAFENINHCIIQKIPVVSGTTGWDEKKNQIIKFCKDNKGTFFYASNFSIGMNLFFELNKNLSNMMSKYPEYIPSIQETHHLEKKDTPSGTSLTLLKELPKSTEIISKREEGIIGIHKVKYDSEIDDIEIIHNAKSRKGFALGALMAAEWIKDKTGFFCMSDLLKFNK